MLRRVCLSLVALAACVDDIEIPQSAHASTGAATGPDTTDSGATTLVDPSSTGSTAATNLDFTTSSSTTDDSAGVGFVVDAGPSPLECSVIEQDCPPGEKCSPWADDGGSAYNASRCVPLDPARGDVDEPCTVRGTPTSGMDTCGLGLMCWFFEPGTSQGVCTPHCTGIDNAPTCDDPHRRCMVGANGVPALCLPNCDPLDPTSCWAGQGCYPVDDHLTCAPDASGDGGGPFETCEFINGCAPGSACLDAEEVGPCESDEAATCCTPFCSLTDPTCPQGTVCVPYHRDGAAAPKLFDLGFCGSPT